MSGADIGPGDYVECVASSRPGHAWEVVAGQVYVVRSLTPFAAGACFFCKGPQHLGLNLTTDPAGIDGGWCPTRFRRLYRPKAELIERLLAPAPEIA